MMDFMSRPGAKMSNYAMPRPAGPVMGPPRLKMPSKGGDAMPRSSASFPNSHLGFQTKLLPESPLGPFKSGPGRTASLFETDGRGLAGIKRP